MSYFVSREELLFEIEKAVDAIFSAVAKCLSDEDKKFNRKLGELRNEFLLLIDTVGRRESHQSNNKKRRKQMEERGFEEILKELISHILEGSDEKAIILVDELEKSSEKFKEEKEKIENKLNMIKVKTEKFLKQEEEEEKKREAKKTEEKKD